LVRLGRHLERAHYPATIHFVAAPLDRSRRLNEPSRIAQSTHHQNCGRHGAVARVFSSARRWDRWKDRVGARPMSDIEINPGIITSRCLRGAPSRHQPHDATDQSGERSRIGNGSPGARESHSRTIGTSRPHRAQLLAAPIVPRGSAGRMQLLTDDVCIELLMSGSPGIFAELSDWARPPGVLMGRDARLTRTATFRRQGRSPLLNATLR
jgi:hypothetical protein